MEFIYCRRLNSQYFGAPKSGASQRLRVLRGRGSYATVRHAYYNCSF